MNAFFVNEQPFLQNRLQANGDEYEYEYVIVKLVFMCISMCDYKSNNIALNLVAVEMYIMNVTSDECLSLLNYMLHCICGCDVFDLI